MGVGTSGGWSASLRELGRYFFLASSAFGYAMAIAAAEEAGM